MGSGSGGAAAVRVTWTATQSGKNVSGPATFSTSPAVSNVSLAGTMNGVLTGTQLTLVFVAPAGSVPSFPNCAASASGSAVVTGDTMSGNLNISYTACDALGLQPPARSELMLAKQ